MREVSEVLRARAEFLAVEADVVGVTQHLFQEVTGFEDVAHP